MDPLIGFVLTQRDISDLLVILHEFETEDKDLHTRTCQLIARFYWQMIEQCSELPNG